jgi:hypothetical protein
LNVHIQPLAGGGDIAQAVAKVLLRHQSHERQQRVRAQITGSRAKLEHARIVAAPARIEFGIRIAMSRGEGVQPPAGKGPAIARVGRGQYAADLRELGGRAVGEIGDDALRAEIEGGALEHRAAALRHEFEGAGAGIEPRQILGQQFSPARKGHVASARERVPIEALELSGAARRAVESQAAAEHRGQLRRDVQRDQAGAAPQIQVDVGELEPRQSGIPILYGDETAANGESAGRQIVQRQRAGNDD